MSRRCRASSRTVKLHADENARRSSHSRRQVAQPTRQPQSFIHEGSCSRRHAPFKSAPTNTSRPDRHRRAGRTRRCLSCCHVQIQISTRPSLCDERSRVIILHMSEHFQLARGFRCQRLASMQAFTFRHPAERSAGSTPTLHVVCWGSRMSISRIPSVLAARRDLSKVCNLVRRFTGRASRSNSATTSRDSTERQPREFYHQPLRATEFRVAQIGYPQINMCRSGDRESSPPSCRWQSRLSRSSA